MSINNASRPAIKLINEDDIKLSPYISRFQIIVYTSSTTCRSERNYRNYYLNEEEQKHGRNSVGDPWTLKIDTITAQY